MQSESNFPEFAPLGNIIAERKEGESYASYAERRLEAFGLPKRGPISEHAEVRKPKPKHEFDEDLIPDLGFKRTQAQTEMDAVIDRIDVLDAYDRWIGKNREQRNGRDHNIMISCPLPSHPDRTPSASVSFRKSDDGVWSCHKCGVGGDKYDLAAIHFGYDLDGYKNKVDFPALRLKIAEELGYRVMKSGESEWLEPVPAKSTAEDGGSLIQPGESQAAAGEVTDPSEPVEGSPSSSLSYDDDDVIHPTLDWRTLDFDQGTFLHEWLHACSDGDEPEEFYLGLGFIALAAAVGNNVKLADDPLVRPNVMMALVGGSGTGKSIAVGRVFTVLREAFPWSFTSPTGVRQLSGVGSGEDLVAQYDLREADPNGGPSIIRPVNAVLDEDEMASLMARVRRPQATYRQYMMRLFDQSGPVSTSSRTQGGATAEQHFFQCITTTQPGALRDIVSNNDAVSGFLNRWLYIFGNVKRRRAIRTPGLVDLDASISLIQKVRGWSAIQNGRIVKWNDPTARTEFEEYFHSTLAPLMGIEDAWLLQRLDLMAKKICLLLAINDHAVSVYPKHVEQMKKIIEWAVAAFGYVESKVGASDKTGQAMEEIVDLLQKRHPDSMTVREMTQFCRPVRNLQREASWCIDAAIKSLVGRGDIIEVKSPRTVRYQWNDPAYVPTTP